MQKWEYLVMYVYGNTVIWAGDRDYAILEAKNGVNYEVKIEKGSPPAPRLGDFLNSVGQEGWEVTGIIPDVGTGDYWRTFPVKIILKRPFST
jgi:hypothetical protein